MEGTETDKKRILVADEEKLIRKLAKFLLKSFIVLEASTPDEAKKIIKSDKQRVDLVLVSFTDLWLPVRRTRRAVVAVTYLPETPQEDLAKLKQPLIPKPFSPDLGKQVTTLLEEEILKRHAMSAA